MTADRTVRRARPEDADPIAEIAGQIWTDKDFDDYIAREFPEWVETDGPDQYTAVVTVGDDVVGTAQATMLTADEAWLQGLRVHPDHRGEGHSEALTEQLLSWCREREATVARNMVFGWNTAGMGQSRTLGLSPVTSCRWAHPDPGRNGTQMPSDLTVVSDPKAAWHFWTNSDARSHVAGLALASQEQWAVSELTRERFLELADTDGVRAVVGETVRGVTLYRGLREFDGDTIAEYVVGAWADTDAARALCAAISADAAARGVDKTDVLVPLTPRHVSDLAVARVSQSDRSVYIFEKILLDE